MGRKDSSALLSGAETLPVGGQASIAFAARVVPEDLPSSYLNQALASGFADAVVTIDIPIVLLECGR